MVAGNWLNQDGLYLQFGTQKAVPELGGEYNVGGSLREVEVTVPLTNSISGISSTGPSIVSYTTLFPLQTVTPTATTQNLIIEQVEVETEIGMTVLSGATSISMGLTTVYGSPPAFQAVTPNGGVQILTNLLNASFTTSGQVVRFTQNGAYPTGTAGAGSWLGNVPLVTNAITPLPVNAYFSVTGNGGAGTYSAGIIKVRVKYRIAGFINQ